jgi:hypothetical protein
LESDQDAPEARSRIPAAERDQNFSSDDEREPFPEASTARQHGVFGELLARLNSECIRRIAVLRFLPVAKGAAKLNSRSEYRFKRATNFLATAGGLTLPLKMLSWLTAAP